MTAPTLALNPIEWQIAWPDRAVSSAAKELQEWVNNAIDTEYSVAWGKRQWDLEAACSEASESNWDGYGAHRVDYLTYVTAKKFLEALPTTPIDPEIAVDPDGEVSITWRKAVGRVFSVSVGASGRLSYAGIWGSVNNHGTEYFFDQLPSSIKAGLARLFPAGL